MLGGFWKVWVKLDPAAANASVQLHDAPWAHEGGVGSQHFVNQDAQRPPVRCLAVPLLHDDLGAHVLGRAAGRPRLTRHFLAESKVGHPDSSDTVVN